MVSVMASKSSDWQPGPTVCRCCLGEGCYKDISTEYFWMGKREVYAEMLAETLDLEIAYSQTKGPNSNSRLICEACISRLRDASEFKKQVQECEKTFMQHLSFKNDADDIDDTLDITDVKVEGMKEERLDDVDDDDYLPPPGDGGDSDDDLDDEPLTKLASKVPKKESMDLLEDYVDDDKPTTVVLKRKSTAKTKSTPTKKTRVSKTSQAKASTVKPEKKKKEKIETRVNATALLRFTTAYPFRVHDKWILCVYCHEQFDDPSAFREHMDCDHNTFQASMVFHNLPKREFVKAELTNLRCRICSEPLDTIETAANHLKEKHRKNIDLNEKTGVMPYVLQKDAYNCAVCMKNVPTLLHLNRHTISHFLSHVCHICGSSYIATTGLLRHVRSKHQEYQVRCRTCLKTFPTIDAKDKHQRTEKACGPYCCRICSSRFLDWKSRRRHMEAAHGEAKRDLKCPDCDISFRTQSSFYIHYKLNHSQDYVVCNRCGMKFVSNSKLKRHLSTHGCT